MLNIISRSSRLSSITRIDLFANVDEWFKRFGMRPLSMETETLP